MQNNTDRLDKTREIPEVNAKNNNPDVHKDQQSMFDAEDAFSESMVVEKNDVEINSLPEGGDTVVFDIPEKKEITAKDLEGSAREYYDATHSDSIEQKVDELKRLADAGFEDEEASEEVLVVEKAVIEAEEKKRKMERKLRRKGVISDEDMQMLSEGLSFEKTEFEVSEKPEMPENDNIVENVFANTNADEDDDVKEYLPENGVTYENPLGTEEDEENEGETEEDEVIKALGGGSSKTRITFDSVFGDDEPEAEYTDRADEPEILSGLRKNAIFSALSVILTLIVTVICAYFELASGTKLAHPAIFEAGKFGVTYAMCMLQLLFITVIFNLDGIKRAFRGLRPGKPSAEGFSAATVIVCTIHSILSAILVSDRPELRSFCSAGCLAVLLLSVNSFVKAYTSLTAFCYAASKSPKLSSVALDRESGEAKAFEKYLKDDKTATIFTVGKSNFVKGFFKKCMTVPRASGNTVKMIATVLIIAIVAGVVLGFIKGAYAGVCTFTTICLASLPVNALIATALPFFTASARVKKYQTAFIGEAACDAYETTAVVSFDDTEVFPQKSVKVSSIRTYGDNRIDKVILYMAKIFDKVQGPLSYVFANSVQSLDDKDVTVQITEHFSDGISARIDAKEVLVGTESFMKLYDIETPEDNIDESFTRSLGSIMYMSVDGKLAAKFYIKYTMARSFEGVLHSFYDAGICVGVKTLDPCITNEIVCGNLKGSNYPVSVIKKHREKDENGGIAEETDGAIISLSSVHNFLHGFIKLDNLRNVYRSNTVISTIAAITGIIASLVLNVTGIFPIGAGSLVLFQLVWCLPTVVFSFLSK